MLEIIKLIRIIMIAILFAITIAACAFCHAELDSGSLSYSIVYKEFEMLNQAQHDGVRIFQH